MVNISPKFPNYFKEAELLGEVIEGDFVNGVAYEK
jgi:hypothetical protein